MILSYFKEECPICGQKRTVVYASTKEGKSKPVCCRKCLKEINDKNRNY